MSVSVTVPMDAVSTSPTRDMPAIAGAPVASVLPPVVSRSVRVASSDQSAADMCVQL